MRTLSTGIETYSSVDIRRSGLYRYARSPDFEAFLFAYAYDDNPVQIVDLAQGEKIPCSMVMDLHRLGIMKTTFNAAFEYYYLGKFLETYLEQWQYTTAHTWRYGHAEGLDAIGRTMESPENKWKLSTSKSLIEYFYILRTHTKRNDGHTRNLPEHTPNKWRLFKEYCGQDVVTGRETKNRLAEYSVFALKHQLWVIDQAINIGGVVLDMVLIDGVLAVGAQMAKELTEKAQDIVGLENPSNVVRLKQWVIDNADVEIESLNKQTVADLLTQESGIDSVQVIPWIRQGMAKTSVEKYQAMQDTLCDDGRMRGLLQFHGACRTERWAGRFVQMQNLSCNHIGSLDTAREFAQKQKMDALRVIHGNMSDTLFQLVRATFIPGDGHMFAVADFSAIEARVIAWLTGEERHLRVSRIHGKIYEASASTMFGMPVEKIRKGSPEYALHSRGEITELALGYQGAAGALIQMDALQMGLHEEELPDVVQRWRASNKRIASLWYSIERHTAERVEYGVISSLPDGISFSRGANRVMITLPSGRKLLYLKLRMTPDEGDYKRIHLTGQNRKSRKQGLLPIYGGKLTENIVQAVVKDCLANVMVNLHTAGYWINFHIRDKVILEIPKDGRQNLEEAINLVCRPPAQAEGLPLNADGFTGDYYKKEQVYVRE